jgi:methylase of polypeptide subunit release factors
VAYNYLNVPVIKLKDALLLSEDSRIGLVLYAAKCMWRSRNDESKKFQYLRKITTMWAERGWSRDDKRIILLVVDYLINLKDKSYAKEFVAHMESLKMNEEDKEMYVSVFERVYKEEALAEVARSMLLDGISREKVSQYTHLPREEIEVLSISN